jgi:hypothetical protein
MSASFDEIIESIEQLPESEQERIRRWLDEKSLSSPGTNGSQASIARSAKSLRWLYENREKYLGQWVALDGDHLIASGSSAKEVYEKAKAQGIEIPFVELVRADLRPVTGGWIS